MAESRTARAEQRLPRRRGPRAAAVLVLVAGVSVVPGAAAGAHARAAIGPDAARVRVNTILQRLAPAIKGEGASTPTATTVTVTATIDGYGSPTTYVVNYGTTTAYGQQTAPASLATTDVAQTVSQALSGLQPNTTYHFQFAATNGGGTTNGVDATFTTAPPPPPVVTGEGAQDVTAAAATLYASINANGGTTTYIVNYGPTTAYGQQTAPVSVGAGSTAQETSQGVTGLQPNTTYHFQFVATNAGGTTNGFDTTFTTTAASTTVASSPPAVGAETTQDVTGSTLTAVASINPNGAATTYVVEYGTTGAYGQTTTPASAGAGSAFQTATQPITGLLPNTLYHFRFVATNSGGATDGSDATVTTASAPGVTTTTSTPGKPPPPARGVSADVFPAGGTVLVNGHKLTGGEQVPFGAVVDTTHGKVTLESVSPGGKIQRATFYDGVFKLVSPADHTTELVLTGGNFARCSVKGRRLAAVARETSKTTAVRSLWGQGHGTFVTQGRYAAATVRGTVWETVDRCDGTLVHVTKDSALVTDLETGKVYLVAAGHSVVILAP